MRTLGSVLVFKSRIVTRCADVADPRSPSKSATLKAVGSEGAGTAAAQQAWQQLSAG